MKRAITNFLIDTRMIIGELHLTDLIIIKTKTDE